MAQLVLSEQLFYELFLNDVNANLLYPVPVRLVNQRVQGVQVNSNFIPKNSFCDSSDVLVRRFTLYDVVTGVTSASPSSQSPLVIRYAANISIAIEIRTDKTSYALQN